MKYRLHTETSSRVRLVEAKRALKGLFHPAFLAGVISWLAFVVAIYTAHENGENKGQARDDTYKECWMKQSL